MESQLTLSELNSMVKEALQLSFPEQVWVVAEIAEMKVNRSGHCYIELVDKDSSSDEVTARARATIWAWQFRFIQPYFETTTGQSLAAGLRVLVSASVEFHEVYGYSLNIKDIDPTFTLGDLARKRIEIIRRLTEEGVIDMNKEIVIPDIPSRIAVISSPTAAGYGDFINQIGNNEAGYRFYTKLYPATMQGNDAPASIMAALDAIYENEELFDVVVIIRGGGSQLDLSCFDDYNLALHISQFPLAVLTGIGHEKDDTIADMVAHTRLKTPTAVAEFLIGKFDEAASEVAGLEMALNEMVERKIAEEKNRIDRSASVLKPLFKAKMERAKRMIAQYNFGIRSVVRELISQQQFHLLHISDELRSEIHSFTRIKKHNLQLLNSRVAIKIQSELTGERHAVDILEKRIAMESRRLLEKKNQEVRMLEKNKQLVDPKNILNRGFSITLHEGKVVKDGNSLGKGQRIETLFASGGVSSTVDGIITTD